MADFQPSKLYIMEDDYLKRNHKRNGVFLGFGKVKLMIAILILAFTTVQASHFRHGSISWRVVSGNTVEFKISQAWANYPNWTVGQQAYSDRLYFGDGQYQSFSVTITAVNAADNWVYGETTITHTYSGTGNYTAYFESCCKIGQLSNNANAWWKNETVVNVGSGNESPVVTMAPIINMQAGLTSASFQVPATDPDGDNLTYRLATSSEFRGSQPSGISIHPTTGKITFNTSGRTIGQLWNAAIVVEDGQTKVINDFIIKMVQQSSPPQFDYTVTPPTGTVYQVSPGQNVSFSVKAFDTDPGSTVTLQGIGVPPGVSLSPALPTTGNPVQSSFNWTPSSSNLGTNVINFLAEDEFGSQVNSSVSIVVSLKPVFDVPPTPATGAHNIVVSPGTLISYTVQASDPDPLDVVQIVAVEGKNMAGNPIPLYSGASFGSLPSPAGNPTNGTFSWTPSAADWGHKHVFFTAEDSYGDQTVHEVYQLVNTIPAVSSTPVTTADVGTQYTYNLSAFDPDIPYGDVVDFVPASPLPSWLSISTDPSTGTAVLSGTPGVGDVGTVSLSFLVEDLNHHSYSPIPTHDFSITVNNCVVNAVAQNLSLGLDGNGQASITAGDVDGGSTATCGIASLTVSPNQFDCQSVGDQTVTLTVVDVNGNSSSATATVTVEDNLGPNLQVQNMTLQLDANGEVSLSTAAITAGSTDNCGIEIIACSGGSGGSGGQAAGANLANGIFSGGLTQVVEKTGVNASNYRGGAFGTQCNEYWYPNGSFCDEGSTLDDPDASTKSNTHSGATWRNLSPGNSYGILVVDLGQTSLLEVASVFQMFSDGKTTHIQLFGHANASSAPLASDANWVALSAKTLVGPGSISGNVVTLPTQISLNSMNSRYVKIYAWNDGRYGYSSWTELRSLKLFGASGGECGFTCADVGVNTVTFTATDVNGNTSTASAQITIEDNIAPAMATQNLSIQLDSSGNANILVSDIDNGSSDACGIASLSLDQTAFDCSHVGVNAVTLTGIDVNGNSASATATVTVQDLIAPSIHTQDLTVSLDASGNANIIVADIDNGSWDACGIASLNLDQTAFDCSMIGPNTVTLTGVDIHGNSSSATAIVMVQDLVAPDMLAQDINLALDGSGNASITVADIDNGSSDACGIASLNLDQTSFDCSMVGPNTVTLTGIDVNGNSASVQAIVTVEDLEIPVITNCPGDVEVCGEQAIHWSEPLASDNCLVSFSSDYSSGDIFPVGTTTVTYTALDAGGNLEYCSFNITVRSLPEIAILPSKVPDFCQGLKVLTAQVNNSANLNMPLNFLWSNGSIDPEITVTQPGLYSLTVSDGYGCQSTTSYQVTDLPENTLASYVIIGKKEVDLKETTVTGGGVGVRDANRKAKLKNNTSVSGAVVAPRIDVNNSSSAGSLIYAQNTVPLPFFYSYDGECDGDDFEVKKNQSGLLDGLVYDEIEVDQNGHLIIASAEVYAEELKADKNSVIEFMQSTNIMLEEDLDLDKNVQVISNGYTITFYVGKKAHIQYGSNIEANIYAKKDIHVHGKSSAPTYMTGQFISLEKVKSHKNSYWSAGTNCDPAPVPSQTPCAITSNDDDDDDDDDDGDDDDGDDDDRFSEDGYSKEVEVSVYPNPSSNQFTLKLESSSDLPMNIYVMDLSGRVLETHQNLSPEQRLEIGSDLYQGLYLIAVQQGEYSEIIRVEKIQ